MRLVPLTASVFLIACGMKSDGNERALRSGNTSVSENSTDPGLLPTITEQLERRAASNGEANLDEDESALRYYPLSQYMKYPEDVRSLIRRADMENGRCRGIFDKETYRACNRRELIMIELEKRGWCWGGADVGYLEHWLRCVDDPYRPPGYRRSPHFYSGEEIEELSASPQKP